MSRIGSAVGDISGDLGHMVGSANDAIDALGRLMGMDPGKSLLHEDFKLLVSDLDFIANSVATILEGLHTALAAIPGVAKSVTGAKLSPDENQAVLNLAKSHYDTYEALHKKATEIMDGGKALLGFGNPKVPAGPEALHDMRREPFKPFTASEALARNAPMAAAPPQRVELTAPPVVTVKVDASGMATAQVPIGYKGAGRFSPVSAPNLSRQNDHGGSR